MVAPTPMARGTPEGYHLENSYQCLCTFAANPTVSLWEKTLQPIGIDNGDPVDETTQHNESLRTKAPRALNDLTNGKIKAAYDPIMYTAAMALCGVPTVVTWHLPDGSTLCHYGYLKSFVPMELPGDGTQPEADIEVVCTNRDPNGVEELPVLTNVVGT